MRKKRNTLLRLGPFFNLFYDVFLSYLTVHEAVSEKLGLLSKGYPVEHESDNYVTRGVEGSSGIHILTKFLKNFTSTSKKIFGKIL